MNMALTNKKAHIAKRFGQAASNYNENALVQRQVVSALSEWAVFAKHSSNKALDIGCGTGDIAQRFSKVSSHWLNLDISVGMLKNAACGHLANGELDSQHSYLCGDAESLPLADDSVDFVCSSMALQWCESPFTAMTEIFRVLQQGGRASLAIMVAPSFSVLNRAWESIDMAPRVNTFSDAQHWLNAAERFSWTINTERRTFYTEHTSLMQMLKSIKGVGANTSTIRAERGAFSKAELIRLDNYFSNNAALKLDYELLFFDLRK